jgi:hypothetical protein
MEPHALFLILPESPHLGDKQLLCIHNLKTHEAKVIEFRVIFLI